MNTIPMYIGISSTTFSDLAVLFPHVRFFYGIRKGGCYILVCIEDSAWRTEGLKVGSALFCFFLLVANFFSPDFPDKS
jgi:hypothetical protein